MKKYTSTLLALLLSGTLMGCSSTDTKVKEENKTMPTCHIEEGTPLTYSMLTVHVNCKNGNISIDEATVTVDNTVKNVEYNGTKADDYIAFRNLQSSTSYKATLEVLVGGKTIKKSVKIKTREEKVLDTPITAIDNPPSWAYEFYHTNILITDLDFENSKDKNILNLNTICQDSENDKIYYSVISLIDTYYSNPQEVDKNIMFIDSNILKVKLNTNFSMLGKGDNAKLIVTVRATSNGKSSDIKIDFSYLLAQIEPPYSEGIIK